MKRLISLLIALSLLISITVLAQAENGAGAVYSMTNADEAHGGNKIVVYHRAANGLLTLAGFYATNGNGETTEPGDALGAQNPLILSPDQRFLFAVNAGSDTISVFQVDNDNLTFVQQIDSHGDLPVSLTIHHNLVYVLNARSGGNISGFTLDNNGRLTYLEGSTRPLNADTPDPFFLNSPAQVGFTPLGDKLVVTVKGVTLETPNPKILVFAVKDNGLPSKRPVINDNVPVPFGFVFDDLNNLIVAEPFGDQPPGGGVGAAGSYEIVGNGKLVPISETVPNLQTATCWIAINTSTRFAYATNNGGDPTDPSPVGDISSYKVASDGSLSLINAIAASTGVAPVDLAITPNNQYLYNVNALSGTVSMFAIDQANGNLIPLGEIGGLPDDGSAVGIAVR